MGHGCASGSTDRRDRSRVGRPQRASLTPAGGLYHSDDQGATWRALLPEATFLAVAVSDDGRTVVAVSDSTEVYRSEDGGTSWSAAA